MMRYGHLVPFMLAANTVGCFICLVSTLMALFNRYCTKQALMKYNKEMEAHYEHPLIVRYSFCSMILFCITCGVQNIVISFTHYGVAFQTFQLFTDVTWTIAQVMCYVMFIVRCEHAFKGTQFAISHKMMRLFYGSVVCFVLVNILIAIVIEIIYNMQSENITYRRAFRINAGLSVIGNILDLFISVFTVYVFSTKLLRCMESFNDDMTQNAHIAERNASAVHLSTTQLMLVRMITKCFVLSLVAIISTQIFLFSQMVMYLMVDYRENDDPAYSVSYAITIIFQAWTCAQNTICVYLSLGFSTEMYDKVCYRCDSCVGKMCSKYAKRKMKRVVEMNMYTNMNAPDLDD